MPVQSLQSLQTEDRKSRVDGTKEWERRWEIESVCRGYSKYRDILSFVNYTIESMEANGKKLLTDGSKKRNFAGYECARKNMIPREAEIE